MALCVLDILYYFLVLKSRKKKNINLIVVPGWQTAELSKVLVPSTSR